MSNASVGLSIDRTPATENRLATGNDGALDNFLKIGRYLLVVPMLVFPVFHFIATRFVAGIIPPWIPWHVFFTYFTGISIIAAGLAILFKFHARVPAILLGIEIFLFVALIHMFLIFHKPGDAWAEGLMVEGYAGELNNFFKDLGMSGAVFIFAGTLSNSWRASGRDIFLTIGRTILAACLIFSGVLHFIYPGFAPGLQPMFDFVKFPLPGNIVWGYLTGAALVTAGVCILINWQTRSAAMEIGTMILVFELLVWVPRFFRHPGELAGNWLKDLGMVGGLLILAAALPKKT